MKIKFFGHNCYLLQSESASIIIDPWLSKTGAFFGSWFQWPKNHHLMPELINILEKSVPTILYISHEHQDHFDIDTLKVIRPFISKCIIPKYEDEYLLTELKTLGFEVIELADQIKYFINTHSYIELMIVDTGVNHDSTAIVNLGNETFVNQNDCKIFDRLQYLKSRKIDYYAVQFSGATWHPVCYEIDEKQKKQISKKKVLSKLVAIRNAIELIKPRFYFPSAGPAVFPFLDANLSLGRDNIFIHQSEVAQFLRSSPTRLVFLRPGQTFIESDKYAPIEPPTMLELNEMRHALTCSFLNLDDHGINIDALTRQIELRLEKIKDIKFDFCPIIIFDWGNGGLEIDLNNYTCKTVCFSDYIAPVPHMRISANEQYFNLMSNPQYRWQDIYLSLRARVTRIPDLFNTFVNIFLFSDVDNIRSGFTTTLDINSERMIITSPFNGKNYEVNRYCPHNGADLRDAMIDENNNLICPRHSWLFNLENSGKCNTSDASVNAVEVCKSISLCESISVRLTK